MNTIDHEYLFNLEMSNLKRQGLFIKTINHEIKLLNKLWVCDVFIAQPLDSDGKINMNKLKLNIDPLGFSMGFSELGYYYFHFK